MPEHETASNEQSAGSPEEQSRRVVNVFIGLVGLLALIGIILFIISIFDEAAQSPTWLKIVAISALLGPISMFWWLVARLRKLTPKG